MCDLFGLQKQSGQQHLILHSSSSNYSSVRTDVNDDVRCYKQMTNTHQREKGRYFYLLIQQMHLIFLLILAPVIVHKTSWFSIHYSITFNNLNC